MKSNWLSSMLTKSKQKSTMWMTFADTVQASFAEVLNPLADKITRSRSIMTMNVDEIKETQENLGHFFSVLDAPDTEKGLTLLHRLDQIHLKSTEFPIKDMVRRNFEGLEMDWSPVYAPINQEESPYGTRLIAQAEFDNLPEQDQQDYFMTSRGRMILNLNKYLPPEEEMKKIYDTINETIIPMIPLHIVFDGFFTQVIIRAVFDIHAYSKSTQRIRDKMAVKYTQNVHNRNAEVLDSEFKIVDDFFSVDSSTRTQREAFNARSSELLGEQPLGLIPLGSTYKSEAHLVTTGLNEKSLPIGGNWKSSNGITPPSSNFILMPPSTGHIYHLLNCVIGERYTIKARKESNSRARMSISESNTMAAEVAKVFDETDNRAEYGTTFIATSVAMYIVVKLDSTSQNIASQIEVNKLTAI